MANTRSSRGQRKISDYGVQLIEKQKMKRAYGLREAQFRRYYNLASKNRAQTGTTLLSTLESRLDNVVYRAGLALTRAQARQLISHRHFKLNDKRINLPSIIVKPKDKVAAVSSKKINLNKDTAVPDWLKVDKKALTITVIRSPQEEELPIEYDRQKIVEFYSR